MKTKGITRRDFIGGVSLGVGAIAAGLSPLEAVARGLLPPSAVGSYPPTRTGLRGSHPGSFEVAHSVFREGKRFPQPEPENDDYDLVVVGAGFGGLAAAWFFRQQAGPDARILLLDNHDDFGGHAKRNEFEVDGKTLLGAGGTYYMVVPGGWSAELQTLLQDLKVDVGRFKSEFYEPELEEKSGLSGGIFFDAAHYGKDSLQPDVRNLAPATQAKDKKKVEQIVAKYPISDGAKAKLIELATTTRQPYANLPLAERRKRLRQTSYEDFLRTEFGAPDDLLDLLRNSMGGIEGFGLDVTPALNASFYQPLGLYGLDPEIAGAANYAGDDVDSDMLHHFPDGNAGLARMMVRRMIPGSAPGNTMEDIVTARFDYDRLDRAENAVRLRLESTVIDVRNAKGGDSVDVTYVKDGTARRVRGKHAVVACWGNVIPHICPELDEAQKQALQYPEKWPYVSTNIALRNWKPIAKSGRGSVYVPNGFFNSVGTETPISMGDYRFSRSPEEPLLVRMGHFPGCFVRQGNVRERFKMSRHSLLTLTYDDFEKNVVDQLQSIYGPYGFDAEEHIAAITVNRWPHGVTYVYNSLFDPMDWGGDKGPHIQAQQRLGRISFAGSDIGGDPLTQCALEEGLRAVREQLAVG